MIALRNLKKRFDDGSWIAYRNRIFETGRSYVLLGASGSGKSTLLNMISGVLSPSEGEIEIDGKIVSSMKQRQKDAFRIAKIGYIFQDFRLIEEMTVQDNLDILRLEHVDISDADAILARLSIEKLKKRRVSHLSGGEKQRVAIARALAKKPDLILADEPTGSLNYATGRAVMEQLKDAAGGRTLLCVTHDDRLSDLFDEVLDMREVAQSGEEAPIHA
ncbi:MAG: ABC transporter ATP-binding protein [Christensenellales bacterium]|jgi:putative ABC transport system ATP-binding protein